MLVTLCFGVRICYLIRTIEKGGFFTNLYSSENIPLLNCTFQLSCKNHLLSTVQTADVDGFGSTDGIAATGAKVLACAGCSWRWRCRCSAVRASTGDSVTEELVTVYQNVAQIVIQTELQEAVAGTGDCPTVFIVVIDNQASHLGCCLEFAVVVGVAAAAILDALNVVVIVNHLMQQRGGHLFDRARQCSCADVDFMSRAQFGNPCVLSQ